VVAGAAVVVLAAALGLSVWRTRRQAEVAALARETADAVAAARRADAMTWAPTELLEAESVWRTAERVHRAGLAAPWRTREFAVAARTYRQAAAGARRAAELARDRKATARQGAADALADAERTVGESERLASTIHLGLSRQILLARARLALDEARVYHREGEYGSATLLATRARTLAEHVGDLAAEAAARYADEAVLATWQRWKAETVAWSRREGRPALVVSKESHTVTLYVNGEVARVYRADMGYNWVADKRHAGDGATPEGRYRVVARKERGATVYYKALLLDYPNAEDRQAFLRRRRTGELAPSAGIGGLIEIHGEGGRGRDWTRGCVALANSDMDDLFARVGVGTPVTIIGSDGPGLLATLGSRAVGTRNGQP
jgi:lipoprotein-anchoring transpeptidase ErfK/SrfK